MQPAGPMQRQTVQTHTEVAHMIQRPSTSLLTALVMIILIISSACGPTSDDAPVGTNGDHATQDNDDAAGGTTMRVYTVTEALALDTEDSVHVAGFLIDEGDGWRLCAAALESYPPQCGGDALTVERLDTSVLSLQVEGTVRWQDDVTLVGVVDGDVFTVTASAAAS